MLILCHTATMQMSRCISSRRTSKNALSLFLVSLLLILASFSNVVFENPNVLHRFYTKQSTLSYSTEGDESPCYGQHVCSSFFFGSV